VGIGMVFLIQSDGKVSCRSTKGQIDAVNCATYCAQFKGGGHASAAGFQIGDASEWPKDYGVRLQN
jgi:nanoRNase/pAp phosphatase (c-di-AMP/oligoRNAs hydrolase)